MSATQGPVIFLMLMMIGPIIAFFVMRAKAANKMLCVILEKDRSVRKALLKVQGDWVIYQGDRYMVNPTAVRFERHPGGWPVWMQTTVPSMMYEKGNSSPIDWSTANTIVYSAKDLGTIMEPEWLARLVKGTQEAGKAPGRERMMQMITLGAVGIVAILMFYVISKMGVIEQSIAAVSSGGGP